MSESDHPTLICLTPIKNEAWILERFLQCASTWADHIIVADQQSDDASREIAQRFEKVTLIDNNSPAYDEAARQRLLIDAARAIPSSGPRILIALDADEMLSANWMQSAEWRQLLAAEPGTVLRFQWANVGPDVETVWLDPDFKPFGFIDDGTPHTGRPIHSPRIPVPNGAPTIHFQDINVLHYQYANWERMKSKQRWYQCWERLKYPDKRPALLYRQYHHMDEALERAEPMREDWIRGYEEQGIDMKTIPKAPFYHWDRELVDVFEEHGTHRFRKLSVWDVNWETLAARMGRSPSVPLSDPRSVFDKRIHDWLADTQASRNQPSVRIVQKLLSLAGW